MKSSFFFRSFFVVVFVIKLLACETPKAQLTTKLTAHLTDITHIFSNQICVRLLCVCLLISFHRVIEHTHKHTQRREQSMQRVQQAKV